jgi:hypothetical protein
MMLLKNGLNNLKRNNMEAFILDLNFLKEQNLSVIEFIVLLQLNNIQTNLTFDDNVLNDLQEKQFIKLIDKETILREKSKLLIDFLSIESNYSNYKDKKVIKKSNRIINEGFDEFIEEYRNLWKGLKVGSMGSPNACKEKMERWMKENPNYSKEDILKAAKIYINSLNNYQYLQAAHYFIYKKDGKEEDSRLSAFIEEKEVDNTDWTTKLS